MYQMRRYARTLRSTSRHGRNREDAPHRWDRAEQSGDEEERRRAERGMDRGPEHEAAVQLSRPDRCRHHPVVLAHPYRTRKPRTHRFRGRELHRARHEKPGRDEIQIAETAHRPGVGAHETAQTDTHRPEVERGLDEGAEREAAPQPGVDAR